MKKLYAIMVLISISLSALAQGGRELYNKYSDLPGMEAVYISPAMFRMIGRIPDVEFYDEDINFSPIIKSMTGFYILSTENRRHAAELLADVKRYIKNGKFELLMEFKDGREITRMYTAGDETNVTSFVMVEEDWDEVSIISFDGKMDRTQMSDLVSRSARRY